MITYIIWGIILVALVISLLRITRGVIVFLVFLAVLIFSLFFIDKGTELPIRDYVPLDWMDEMIDEPERVARETGEDIVETGEGVADKITDAGNKLDIKYGTGKEWDSVDNNDTTEEKEDVEETEKEEKEVDNEKEIDKEKEDKNKEEKKKDTSKKEKEKKKENKGNKNESKYLVEKGKEKNKTEKASKEKDEIYVPYGEVSTMLKTELSDLSKKDKELIKSMSGIYKTKIEGEEVVIWNNKGKGNEGLNIRLK